MTDDEWAVHKAFYDLTVKERDAAWVECAHLRAEIERLRAQRVLSNEDFARSFDMGLAAGERRERAAVVAFLRETLAASETAHASDDLDYAIDIIERGEHRREEKP